MPKSCKLFRASLTLYNIFLIIYLSEKLSLLSINSPNETADISSNITATYSSPLSWNSIIPIAIGLMKLPIGLEIRFLIASTLYKNGFSKILA